ncbi:MAG TPA: VanZ family protein [Vicinamibacterales bacterium]|nr:VanZ family protein [Vicinamibacterales bacterium]
MSYRRLFLAIAAAAAVVLSAPFVSQIRFWIRATFPGHFVIVVGGLIAVAVAAALVAAFLRIRDRRVPRYTAIAAAVLIAAAYSAAIATDNAQANAVERFHFVEYGLVTFLFYRAWRPLGDASVLVLPILAGLIVGTLEEWFQWFLPVRVGEMRDVFLNLAAIVCGLLFSTGVDPPEGFGGAWRAGSLRRVGWLGAAVILGFAAFLDSVHLGHAIVDPVAGTFTSRYTVDELDAHARDRAVRWSAAPPVVRSLSREDQYLSEGILHVQERNRLWDAGDASGAWHENLILETYYEPVLGTTYPAANGSPHRWPEAHRDAAAAQARLSAPPYVSCADGGFIRTWPGSLLWSLAVALAAAALAAGYLLDRRQRPARVPIR